MVKCGVNEQTSNEVSKANKYLFLIIIETCANMRTYLIYISHLLNELSSSSCFFDRLPRSYIPGSVVNQI